MALSQAPKRIALVVGSTRNPRVGPSLAQLVRDTVTADAALSKAGSLEILDIADFKLPVFDEPTIPMQVKSSDGYAHAHTRAWSEAVSRYQGFVFLTPQYNLSLPASLKNALDYLFNEWGGKPALVLSYGAHGGDKGAAHLTDVANALRMKVVGDSVGFPMGAVEGAMGLSAQGKLFPTAAEVWADQLAKTKELFAEVCKQA